MEIITKWIALITGLTALITSVTSLITSCENAKKTEQIVEEVRELKNCRYEVVVNICNPGEGDQVPKQIDIIGTSTVHPTCRYVFLFAQDVLPTGVRRWKVVDVPQLQNNGKFAGTALLDYVPLGQKVTLVAHITGNSKAYKPHQVLYSAPDYGMPSNFVNVRRTQ